MFDDWEENLPIITQERVKDPYEATLEYFSIPKEKRNVRLNYTDHYEE